MKKIFAGLIVMLCLMPNIIFAKKIDLSAYNTENLEEVFKEEAIDYDLKNYKETDDQVTIYFFRGKGCPHCQDFLKYFNSILPTYGDKFKVLSFETWYDNDNYALLNEVATFLGYDPTSEQFGVPFVIIGDKVFMGYDGNYDSEIEQAITNLYNSDDRYDVFDEMANSTNESSSISTGSVIICNLLFIIVGVVIIMLFINNKFTKLNEHLNAIDKRLKK